MHKLKENAKKSLIDFNQKTNHLKTGRPLGKKAYKEEVINAGIKIPKSFYEKNILKDCKTRTRQDVLWEIIENHYNK